VQKGEFEPIVDYQQRLKDSSLVVFQRIYVEAVHHQINESVERTNLLKTSIGLTYDTERKIFSVFFTSRDKEPYYNPDRYHDTLKSFISIPLSEAKEFKERWMKEESESKYVMQDHGFIGGLSEFQLLPKVIQRTVNGQTYTLPIHEIFREFVGAEERFTSKDFKEISLAFNSLGIENDYLRNVELIYSDKGVQVRQQRIDETKSTRTAEHRQPITYHLHGRSVVKESPLPVYNGKGEVRVYIDVDRNGKVFNAKVGAGTTINDAKLWKAAEKAAKKTRFSVKEYYDELQPRVIQTGAIMYVFGLK
jgi:hypothetical protein